ncbi:hypothetical protein BRC89_03640 [Halobacteriales archaeon QS_4_70_19]|nr:MAG: hypothetical protein BRC89_03640 [Halobacteriales archaeon QS_4_70_19]
MRPDSPDDDPANEEPDTGRSVSRRQVLAGAAAATGIASAATVNRFLLGYGTLSGTNVTEQSLSDLASAPFAAGTRTVSVPGGQLELTGDRLTLVGTDSAACHLPETTPERGAELAAQVDIDPEPVRQVVADVRSVRRGNVRFAPVRFDEFSDAVARGRPRPATTGLLRSPRAVVAPADVWAFVGEPTTAPTDLLRRLAERFHETTAYDLTRFAGNVVENRLPGGNPRRPLSESSFSTLRTDDADGLLCWDYTRRGVEAIHAVPALDGRPAAAATPARDDRHGHVFMALAAVTRRGDGVPAVVVTFVEFVHSALYGDVGLRGALGADLNAYDELHRVTSLPWWNGA